MKNCYFIKMRKLQLIRHLCKIKSFASRWCSYRNYQQGVNRAKPLPISPNRLGIVGNGLFHTHCQPKHLHKQCKVLSRDRFVCRNVGCRLQSHFETLLERFHDSVGLWNSKHLINFSSAYLFLNLDIRFIVVEVDDTDVAWFLWRSWPNTHSSYRYALRPG